MACTSMETSWEVIEGASLVVFVVIGSLKFYSRSLDSREVNKTMMPNKGFFKNIKDLMAANNTVTIHGSIQDRYNIQLPKSARQEVFGLHYPLGSSKNGGVFNKNIWNKYDKRGQWNSFCSQSGGTSHAS